jgi:pimeloyl-ACP methyl ester carboxylesterase
MGAALMATRETVTVNGIDISYVRAGEGRPLVMLHGIGGNATQFQHQFGDLTGDWTLIAWDAPGYGGSDDPSDDWLMADYAAALAGLLDELGLDRVTLLGQSWGGVLAQTFVGRYPERVRALVLSDTSMGGRSQPDDQRLAALDARLAALETMTPAELAVARAPAIVGPNPSADILREAETMMAQIRPSGYRRAAIALAEADTRAVHSGITVPTLILAGEHDGIVPPDTAAALQSAIPGAQLVTIPGVGHLSGQEDPASYNAALRSFMERTDGS